MEKSNFLFFSKKPFIIFKILRTIFAFLNWRFWDDFLKRNIKIREFESSHFMHMFMFSLFSDWIKKQFSEGHASHDGQTNKEVHGHD